MLTNSLSLNSKVVQKTGHVVSDMDGNKVMLSFEQGKYYNLGNIGGNIWDLMEKPIPISAIISSLLSTYEVEEQVCKDQLLNFISQLSKEDLVVIQD